MIIFAKNNLNLERSEQELVRRDKLKQLRALGIDPYPAAAFYTDANSETIINEFVEGRQVTIAGRLMSRRIQGKASFAELQDSQGRIQVYFNRDILCPTEDKSMYNDVYKKLLDIGDIIGINGTLFTTQVGEKTVQVESLSVLSKSLRPLPLPKTDANGNTYDSFSDPEQRYRMRYVDLIVNPQVKDTFLKRTKITNIIRSFFNDMGYLEVETPILQPIPGGAAARPFVTHHNALNIPLYLRIANELYLKRLIVGGLDGVYEFAKDFRNEGMDKTHNPEFTVMELYVAYKDYHWMMETTEILLEKIAVDTHGSSEVKVGEKTIDFKAPYPRVPILEAIKKHTNIDVSGMDEKALRTTARSLEIEVDDNMGIGKIIDEIFGSCCEHHYVQPTFITDYPKEMSPLTKIHRKNPGLTERFEYQLILSEKGDDEAMFIDQDFVRALEYGMPPTSGIGIGIDRLVMLMTNNSSIQEVLFFPQMRPELQGPTLTDEEEVVLNHLKKNHPVLLSELKENAGLSNKKWDNAIKGLSTHKLAKVTKSEDGLFVHLLA